MQKEKPDAKFAYYHIVEPKMLLWLIEAAGVKWIWWKSQSVRPHRARASCRSPGPCEKSCGGRWCTLPSGTATAIRAITTLEPHSHEMATRFEFTMTRPIPPHRLAPAGAASECGLRSAAYDEDHCASSREAFDGDTRIMGTHLVREANPVQALTLDPATA